MSLNVSAFDALKWRGTELRADAKLGLDALSGALSGWRSDAAWQSKAKRAADRWRADVERITGRRDAELPYEGEVIGAVQRSARDSATRDIVVCAAGTLPAELHKLWRTSTAGGYHVEYGYSCMGYEIAGGLGVKMARPESEVIVIVGDGSYLMLNSEIATSVMLGRKLIIVVLDNHGYGCINRLQQACGGEPFNNLFDDCVRGSEDEQQIDFAAQATAIGALAEDVNTITELESALQRACADRTCDLHRDRPRADDRGGRLGEVPVPAPDHEQVREARAHVAGKRRQKP